MTQGAEESVNPRLIFVCDDLAKLPRFPLPAGYRLKWHSPGDEHHWLRIHELADRFTNIRPGLFRDRFGDDDALLARRQVYALDAAGTPVGTVTAWQGEFRGETIGRVHWLAVVPGHQGRGLGRALISVCCDCLMRDGFRRAYLVTGAARTDALRLYSSMGWLVTSPG